MSINKSIDVQNSQEIIDVFFNFLDIEIAKQSNEKNNNILTEIFVCLNNLPRTSETLESKFIERLSLEFLKFDNKKNQNKLDSKSNQQTEKIDIKVQKYSTDCKNDFSKNRFHNQMKSLETPFSSKIEGDDILFQERLISQNLVKSLDKKTIFTEDKLVFFLTSVKKALENFKKENKISNNLKILDNGNNLNRSFIEPIEKIIKLNFKLLDDVSLQTLQKQISFIQTRQDLIPLGIVGYHEKDKKLKFSKKIKKKKKYLYSKQMKEKKETFE